MVTIYVYSKYLGARQKHHLDSFIPRTDVPGCSTRIRYSDSPSLPTSAPRSNLLRMSTGAMSSTTDYAEWTSTHSIRSIQPLLNDILEVILRQTRSQDPPVGVAASEQVTDQVRNDLLLEKMVVPDSITGEETGSSA